MRKKAILSQKSDFCPTSPGPSKWVFLTEKVRFYEKSLKNEKYAF